MEKLKSLKILRLILPGEGATKKNSEFLATNKTTGKQFILPDPRYTRWEERMFPLVRDWMGVQAKKHQLIYPIAQVTITAHFYQKTLRRKDGLGIFQAVSDLLEKCKVIGDDEWTQFNGGTFQCSLDRKKPRVELWLHVISYDRSTWEDHKIENIRNRNKKYSRKPKPGTPEIT